MSEKKTEKQEKKKKPTVRSPLVVVKEKFGDKAKLVEASAYLIDGLLWQPEVKSKFGTRDKLIGEILVLEKRVKDDGFKKRISAYPVPRLYDLYKASARRAKAAKAETK